MDPFEIIGAGRHLHNCEQAGVFGQLKLVHLKRRPADLGMLNRDCREAGKQPERVGKT